MYFEACSAKGPVVLCIPDEPKAKDAGLTYIKQRIRDLYFQKHQDLRYDFELDGVRPKSFKEARDWLKKGNFRFEYPDYVKEDTEFPYYGIMEAFQWGEKGPDREGFEAAVKELDRAKQRCTDIVFVVTDEERRLAALKEFEEYN
jgi:hypothetical protein